MQCHMCSIELRTSLDVYGDVGEELCQSCFLKLAEAGQKRRDTWYGLSPHRHVLFDDGRIKGHFTEMIDYSNRPQQDGWYEIEPGLWFWPDAEADGGQGIWEDRRSE